MREFLSAGGYDSIVIHGTADEEEELRVFSTYPRNHAVGVLPPEGILDTFQFGLEAGVDKLFGIEFILYENWYKGLLVQRAVGPE